MSKNVIGTTAVAVAALTLVAVLRALLPDIQRYLRISRM